MRGGQCQLENLPTFTLNGCQIKLVDHFKYLGGYISSDGSMKKELSYRISLAAYALRRLKILWKQQHVQIKTKLTFYNSLVLSVLLYGAESWCCTGDDINRLETFHRRNLREILGVSKLDRLSNEELLKRSGSRSMSHTLRRIRLRWLGHIGRLSDDRLTKRLLFSQLGGQRAIGKPPKNIRRLYHEDQIELLGSTARAPLVLVLHSASHGWKTAKTKTWNGLIREKIR